MTGNAAQPTCHNALDNGLPYAGGKGGAKEAAVADMHRCYYFAPMNRVFCELNFLDIFQFWFNFEQVFCVLLQIVEKEYLLMIVLV